MAMGLPYREVQLWQALLREQEEILMHDEMGL